MRSHLEFRSVDLLDPATDEDVPRGERVASLLAARLPDHGFEVKDHFAEDWGWCVRLANADFPLWIGCGHYQEYDDGHLCFIEPSKPVIRRWLKKIETAGKVEPLATAMERVLRESGQAHHLSWWTPEDAARGGPTT